MFLYFYIYFIFYFCSKYIFLFKVLPPWRNWITRMTSNHKIASSSLAGGDLWSYGEIGYHDWF